MKNLNDTESDAYCALCAAGLAYDADPTMANLLAFQQAEATWLCANVAACQLPADAATLALTAARL